MLRARTRARVHRICRWCSHDDANRGQGGACTIAGDIPLDNAGLERMCFGDIVKRAQESSAALRATICDPRRHDHGGRPDATRERVSHAQEIARHRQLLRDARAEYDPFRQKEAYDEAALFRKYRTLYVVPGIHGVCKAREHVKQHTFPPAKCVLCGAWGVQSELQADETFGKECCNHGMVNASHLPTNELDEMLMLDGAAFQAQDPMKLRIYEMLLRSTLRVPSCSPAVAMVVRNRLRDVNNELAFTSWAFKRSKNWAAANRDTDRGALHDGVGGYRYEVKICGRVHHCMGSLGNDHNHRMRNAAYYVHDAEAASQERMNKLLGRISLYIIYINCLFTGNCLFCM